MKLSVAYPEQWKQPKKKSTLQSPGLHYSLPRWVSSIQGLARRQRKSTTQLSLSCPSQTFPPSSTRQKHKSKTSLKVSEFQRITLIVPPPPITDSGNKSMTLRRSIPTLQLGSTSHIILWLNC